jgi:HEAT repeats
MRLRLHRRLPRRPAALLASLLALALTPLPHARAAAEVYWVDGYELKISLEPGRSQFVLGEPLYVSLDVENRSDTDLELMWSGEQGPGWPDDFEMSVIGPDGHVLPRPPDEEVAPDTGYYNGRVHAPGNAERVMPRSGLLLDLRRWAKIEKPGLYTVVCRRGLRAGPYVRRYRLFPGTTRPAVEVRLQTEIKVVEGGPERIGKLIEELSARMLGGDGADSVEAAMRLASLDDERIVKPFVEAFGACRTASIRAAAVRTFARFPNDEAFAALKRAAADPDDDTRTLAAQELAGSKHPKARALLLSMRRDAYFGVRMMVLDALEAQDTQEARRLIWEMAHDEIPLIRDEALRFLQERPVPSRP